MLRNKEIRRFAVLFLAIASAASAAGFFICPAAGALAAASAAALGAAFFAFTRARYRSIARISEQIDLVLHDAERLWISEAEEGELSILQSEITKMTLRIREQNDALKREKQRLADSLADIAHQLRTPLTSANLILSLLEKEPEKGERRLLLREAEELFLQMEWLVNSLLKLSRLDAGIVAFEKTAVDVEELVAAALSPFAVPMELHGISVRTDVPEGVLLSGDAGWLSEAMQNILKNCMESAGDGGKLEIVCRDTPLFTEITLRDDGAGFSEEDLPHLFDRFYRGRGDSASGYGIGLALCRTIINRQGGTIAAKNHPQGGAVFTLRFPK